MLYTINIASALSNPAQNSIVHLEFDLRKVIEWAEANNKRWALTLSNAGSSYFEDRCTEDGFKEIRWDSVKASQWNNEHKEGKQAEFLVEDCVPWNLVEQIGIKTTTNGVDKHLSKVFSGSNDVNKLFYKDEWYY